LLASFKPPFGGRSARAASCRPVSGSTPQARAAIDAGTIARDQGSAGVIGVGNMGLAMAARLGEGGRAIFVRDVRADREAMAGRGGATAVRDAGRAGAPLRGRDRRRRRRGADRRRSLRQRRRRRRGRAGRLRRPLSDDRAGKRRGDRRAPRPARHRLDRSADVGRARRGRAPER
jgi:hypothetical protein